jgi:AraC family transcriptional regulator, regulatory protein of adaptative response / DNA-3-methyladenine glycosylase II
MVGGLSKAACYRAILKKDRRYDGIFYFALTTTGIYCRPSCPMQSSLHNTCLFFDTIEDAQSHGYQGCKRCHPDRLKNNLSAKILHSIDAGAINDLGVRGLAESLHISERHLRRIVWDKTGTSPIQFNRAKRLGVAKWLVIQTKLPIIDIAFSADFSSLRQFNDVFQKAFKTSPREMRKVAALAPNIQPSRSIMVPLRLSYNALLHTPSVHQSKIKVGYEKI